ncbi:hypothetical protein L2K70_12460 [Nocardioides KLBMP 9356]|uniref:Uncharacterized protein n=1 Tax=Nocardioides potassii TaxID=2911371 RepID=A0ABS9HDK7_9ACTN|nr:hypothetical protein [Nocardioides potassii]MCF6378418.1 hypothetical protein [Nocardioides potassii]
MPTTIHVLGPTRVETSAGILEMAARKQRGLGAALVIDRVGVSTADRLVELLWGDDAPAGAFGTLHSYISGCAVSSSRASRRARPRACWCRWRTATA